MDYQIRINPKELDSTGYMEIGPGKYSKKHWQSGFLFIEEDAFGVAEGIVTKHYPSYDHFEMNDIQKVVGIAIISEWRRAAQQLKISSGKESYSLLNLSVPYRENLADEVEANEIKIAELLNQLSDRCEEFYKTSDWICILGM